MASIGKMLKEARERLEYQQQEVAELVNVTSAYICRLEKGISIPGGKLCFKLAKLLKIDSDELRLRAIAAREKMDFVSLVRLFMCYQSRKGGKR